MLHLLTNSSVLLLWLLQQETLHTYRWKCLLKKHKLKRGYKRVNTTLHLSDPHFFTMHRIYPKPLNAGVVSVFRKPKTEPETGRHSPYTPVRTIKKIYINWVQVGYMQTGTRQPDLSRYRKRTTYDNFYPFFSFFSLSHYKHTFFETPNGGVCARLYQKSIFVSQRALSGAGDRNPRSTTRRLLQG